MILAKNEEIIKKWDYCQTGRGITGNGIAILTVTNKRIVSEISESAIARKESLRKIEVLTKDICGLTINKRVASNLKDILFIVLGLIVIIIGIALCAIVNAVCLLISVVDVALLVVGIRNLNRAGFNLIIKSRGMDYSLLILAASTLIASKKKSSDIKIKTDKNVISEIYNTIGAAIIES